MNDVKICKCGIAAVDCEYHKSSKYRVTVRHPCSIPSGYELTLKGIASSVLQWLDGVPVSAVTLQVEQPGAFSLEIEWRKGLAPLTNGDRDFINHVILTKLPYTLNCVSIKHLEAS